MTDGIICIGNSFTEGIGVRFEPTIMGGIADFLERRGLGAFNAGVVSLLPSLYYHKVRYHDSPHGRDVARV